MARKIKLSTVSLLHYYKLVLRSVLFAVVLVSYIGGRIKGERFTFEQTEKYPVLFAVIWVGFAVEMLLRFFPSKVESPGCQKQFKRNYISVENSTVPRGTWQRTFICAAVWTVLNSVVGALYFTGIIDQGILVLISLAYAVCDMICILFFCPFQTWFLKNKCCGSCRIYNWDFAMMFTPFLFIPHMYTWSLLGIALLLLAVWEITYRAHPERFYECTNEGLSCTNCTEKLCHHKTQLRHFIKKNKDTLILKGNTVIEKAKKKLK
ncbi:MAG: hypothetical protein IJ002_08340 [Clostridia bacterium]|nr:hypothetical protein [Clostridia bacterium]